MYVITLALVVIFINACNGDRREAFNIVVLFWLVCGVLLLLLTRTVLHDEEVVQESVKQSMLRIFGSAEDSFSENSCDGDVENVL